MHKELSLDLPVGAEYKQFSEEQKEVLTQVRERAENLFDSREMLCAEAVIFTLNETFGGPLKPEEAIRIGSPFCVGMGGAGCTCGALSGALAAAGVFMGRENASKSGGPARQHAKELHDEFRAAFGSTCCRVLIRHVKNDKKAHHVQCRTLTGYAAEMTARRLLEKQASVNKTFLAARSNKLQVLVRRVLGVLGLQ